MLNRTPSQVPGNISSEQQFLDWFDDQLERLGEEPEPFQEISLYRYAYDFCRNHKHLFNPEFPEYYKKKYVYVLMDNGWTVKKKTKGLNTEATPFFQQALTLIPENPLACYRLGHLMLSSEKKGNAIGHFARALELSLRLPSDLQRLALNNAQIDNARGMLIALTDELSAAFPSKETNLRQPEQVNSLRNLLRHTWRSYVVYSVYDGSVATDQIPVDQYYQLLDSLSVNPQALIINLFEGEPTIGHNDKVIPISEDRLYYLLNALKLVPDKELEVSHREKSRATTISRLRVNLKTIGISTNVLRIKNNRDAGLSVTTSLTIHYFKSLLD